MIWQSVIALLAGVGVFIVGMNMMGDGLERSAGKGMKKLLGTISGNRFSGVAVGTAVTGIIQSSSATSVMVIGFVNAGVMTLFQATSIIMGANIGTTVTGILVSLKDLEISLYATLLAFVGVMMTFFKSDKIKNIGNILCGLGVIFIGLDLMSGAFSDKTAGGIALRDFFTGVFQVVNFPLLLILIGALFTGLIQSSSAATGIVIIMASQQAISVENALFIVLGSNIGTCVTAILASMGTSVNARRTALIHLTFNVIGTVVFTAFLWPFADVFVCFLESIVSSTQMQVAWFHVIFNVTTTALLLPFVKQLVKFAELVIKDKPANDGLKFKYVDERLLKTPSIALMQVKKEIAYMAELAKRNLELSLSGIKTGDEKFSKEVYATEKIIDFTNQGLTKFLIKLSPHVDETDERIIGSYFHVLNDLERIGDHAENFYEIGVQMKNSDIAFSKNAQDELTEMYQKVFEMFEIALGAFDNLQTDRLKDLTEKENEVDALKKKVNQSHVSRLASGDCSMDHSPYFFSAVAGLERVADHLVNVGYSVVNPTGSQTTKE
ncbi:MAG: Na/Pi cotransporter family protein [Clostridia bacterium]|nr:Na/Pi cotransporter family protein [Clostridia bacterium]